MTAGSLIVNGVVLVVIASWCLGWLLIQFGNLLGKYCPSILPLLPAIVALTFVEIIQSLLH